MQEGGGFGPPPGGGFGGQPPAGGGFGAPPGPPPGGGFGPSPGGPPGYGAPGPSGPTVDTLAYVSVGLGVLALLFGCCCGFFNIPFVAGAIGLGGYSLSRQKNDPMLTGKEFAMAGIALGGVGFLIMLVRVILMIAGVGGSALSDLMNR